VLLVHPPPGEPVDSLDTSVEALVAAAAWFARYGGAGCWLVGDVWRGADGVARATVELPAGLSALRTGPAEPPAAMLPVVRGSPRADSAAERSLEAALARQPWAYGRAWNQTYQRDPLTPAVLVDLAWPAERCIVEIDGAEHRGRQQFEADRRRDVRLQLDGYAVLRFTNDQVRYEMHLVLDQLEQFIDQRRTAMREEALDGGRQAVT
jgi:very-short-patch-repair endonuclease